MLIKEMMITDVISVYEDTKLKDLFHVLVENKIGGVPVVSKNEELLGMVTDGDVIRHIHPKARSVYDMIDFFFVNKEDLQEKLYHYIHLTVKEIMTKKKLIKLYPNDSIEKAMHLLSNYHFKKIPVVNNENKVIGVISRGDIIRFIEKQLLEDSD